MFGSRVGHLVAGDADVCSDPGKMYVYISGYGCVKGVENFDGEGVVAVRVEEFSEGGFTVGEDVEGVGRGRVTSVVNL